MPTFCTAATDQGTLAFTTAFQNTATLATGAAHFWRVYAIGGRTYSFSTCGMTTDDTFLRVYDGAGSVVDSRDDNGPYCTTSQAASIDWTPSQSGVYFVHLAQYTCMGLSSATRMAYKASSIASAIISVVPTPGGLGQSITITGSSLGSPTALTINGANALANIVSNTGNVLVVRVPTTATASGNVSITTANGTATSAFALMPTPGNALAFDGTNDYVSLANRTSYSSISTTITLEAWVRTSSTGEQYITTKSEDSWYLAMNGGGTGAGKASFYLNGVSSVSGGWLTGSTTISDGRWHHVAGTYDGTTLKLYVDGVVDASRTVTATIQNGGTSAVYVGSRTTSSYWNGSIDEFRVYNTALTQANILADMRNAMSAVPASQVLYLNFDQGTPATASTGANTAYTTLYDLVSAAPATLTNFALTSGNTTSNYVESYAAVVPTATAATAQTSTGFTANWTAPAVGTVDNGYRLDVATNAAFTAGLTTTTVSGLSQAVTGLTPGTTYYYRVRADKTSVTGQGAYSNTITACALPVAVAQNVIVALNASGSATATAAAVNNGSTAGCGGLSLGLQKVVSGQMVEGGSLTLTAPAGQVFTAVTFASYGTPTLNSNGTYSTSGCHSTTSQAQVESYLLGQNTATIPATNGVFGDPCVGTVKALAVQAVYGPALTQLTYTCAEIGTNLVLLSATDANGNTTRTNATVTVQDNLAPAAPGSGSLPAAPVLATRNVPEAGNYGILYQLDVPNSANFNSLAAVPYTVNNSAAAIANPARVAYFMELNNGTTTKWVWASMNNFAANLTQLGLPNPAANNVNLHQSVTGLNVFASAGAGVTTGTNLGTGRIEMWYWNYTQNNVDNVPGANSGTYDFGDEPNVGSGNYGSFQVHNVTAGQTVLAYNNWGANGSNSDIGIGNQPTGNPDWTFTNNTGGYTVKRIYILVPNGGAFTQPATVALNASGSATVANTQVYTGATDNCGVASVVVTPNTFSCAQAGTSQLVTVAVNDASGNTTTQSAFVTVQDNLAPTVVTQAVSASVGTNGRVYVAPSAVNNGSADNCAITNLALSASSFGACAASAALNLDGTDDYVSLPSGLTSTATNFTFEAWVNYTDNGNWTRVFDFGTGTNVYMLLTPKANWDAASANHPAFAISTGSSAAEQRVISSVVMPTGWHHLAVTLSKTGTVVTGTLYLDGTVIGTNAAMTLTPADLGTLTQNWLGRSQFGQDPYYKGLLDEVRIWSTARTAAEINLYKDKSLAGNTVGLLAYYDFNDAPGSSTVADRTAAARTGTLNNFTQSLAFQAPGQVPALGIGANVVTLTASDIFGNVSSTTATVTVTVPTPTVATWSGSLSNEWSDCRNWQYGTLPGATTDVVIPMVGTALYPTLSAGTGTAKNLTLVSGTSLTVASGADLQVNGNWMNNGGTTTMSGTVTLTGSATTQTIGGTTGTPFNTLVVNKASGTVQLAQNLTINTALNLTSGILNTSSYQVNMGGMATISETDANYVIGTVAMSRMLTAGTAQVYGGLGLTLTPAAGSTSPGATLVLRTTGTALSGAGTSRSVLRYFEIRPTTNTGLNVTMSFGYLPHELNGIPTANLRLFKSTTALTGPWMQQNSTTAGTNVVTKTGITSLSSFWTLGSSANPLPVELTIFTAQAAGPAAVRLDWTTASEKNSDRFEVERSINGNTFDRIGTVAAVGTATSPTAYALTDAKLPAGASLLYYRLRQIDLDGTATYSPVRNVLLPGKAGALTLAPNPSRATTLAGATAGAPVEVFDALGRVVLKAKADANGTAALSLPAYLSTGMYVVRSGTQTIRLVVE